MSALRRAWQALNISARELRLDVTLVNGQCFGWRVVGDKEYVGVCGRHVICLKQTPTDTLYSEEYPGSSSPAAVEGMLRSYFYLDRPTTLSDLYVEWSKDAHFAAIAKSFAGVRLIRQDPVECLFSFICSSNNHISRITKMLASLRSKYGERLCTIAGDDYYAFPTVDQLCEAKEAELRDLGFGYRAKYVTETARLLKEKGGEKWLMELRDKQRQEVQDALVTLQGVGRKVADCVALFSLDKFDCIPVDTHIAERDYRAQFGKIKNKTMNKAVYDDVGNFFRKKFGNHAGWAHSVLFTADLAAFRDRLAPTKKADVDGDGGADLDSKGKRGKGKKAAESQSCSASQSPDMTTEADAVKEERKNSKPKGKEKAKGKRQGKGNANVKTEAKAADSAQTDSDTKMDTRADEASSQRTKRKRQPPATSTKVTASADAADHGAPPSKPKANAKAKRARTS